MGLYLGVKKSKAFILAFGGYMLLMIVSFGAWALYYMVTHWENDYGGLFYVCLFFEIGFLVIIALVWKTLKSHVYGLEIDNGVVTVRKLLTVKATKFPVNSVFGYSTSSGLIVIYVSEAKPISVWNLFINDFPAIERELKKLKIKFLGEESDVNDGFGNLTETRYTSMN
ncbi:MAG: hypothetical protein AAF363_16080 [Bacteroidota bacterium]